MMAIDHTTMNLKFAKDFFKTYAHNKPCQIRIAMTCGHQCAPPDTTVLCHPSIAGLKAMGSRAASMPDIGAAWGCRVCHDLCDGRLKPVERSAMADLASTSIVFKKMILQNAILEGVGRTIYELVKAGVLPNP